MSQKKIQSQKKEKMQQLRTETCGNKDNSSEKVNKPKQPVMYEGFWVTLKKTEKYKNLYSGTEAMWSILVTCLTVGVIIVVLLNTQISVFNEMIKNVTTIIMGGIISLLGIVISGLTFTAGSMSIKITQKIIERDAIEPLISIFFSFKFIGVIMAIELVIVAVINIFSYTPIFQANIFTSIISSILPAYLFWFSIFYCVGLLGTCINVFLLNYNLDDKQ